MAAHQVEVCMENGLTGIWTSVQDHAVPALLDAHLFSQLTGDEERARNPARIRLGDVVERGNVPVGNDQQVHRGSRMLIVEGCHLVILVCKFCASLAGNNLAKDTIFFHFLCDRIITRI